MKKVNYIIFLSAFSLLFIAGSLFSQDIITAEEFEAFRQKTERKMDSLEREIDTGNKALEIAERYSRNADKITGSLLEKTLNLIQLTNYLFWVIGGIFLLFNGIVALYFYKKEIPLKVKDVVNQQIGKKVDEYQKIVDRGLSTERMTIYLKENAYIFFFNKKGTGMIHNELRNVILHEFSNKENDTVVIDSLTEYNDSEDFNKFIDDKNPLKVLVLTDHLLEELPKENAAGARKPDWTSESKKIISAFFSFLDEREIGVVLYGDAMIKKIVASKYLAFANQPYSAYANINNILKFMMVKKNIKY